MSHGTGLTVLYDEDANAVLVDKTPQGHYALRTIDHDNIFALEKILEAIEALPPATAEALSVSSSSEGVTDLRRGLTVAFAPVNVSSGGDNTVVVADATRKIKLLSYVIVADAAVTASWKSGAGTSLSGAMSLAANGGVSSPVATPAGGWLLETAVNEGLVLSLGGAVGVRGHVSYFLEA